MKPPGAVVVRDASLPAGLDASHQAWADASPETAGGAP